MHEITACIIMRNEARILERCLSSLKGAVNSCKILDLGSTDNSVSLAEGLGADVLVR